MILFAKHFTQEFIENEFGIYQILKKMFFLLRIQLFFFMQVKHGTRSMIDVNTGLN